MDGTQGSHRHPKDDDDGDFAKLNRWSKVNNYNMDVIFISLKDIDSGKHFKSYIITFMVTFFS